MPDLATPALVHDDLKRLIREVPDFPKPGILFYDITTLLKNGAAFSRLIDTLAGRYVGRGIDVIAGIEARGFIFGPALAYRLNAGFVPIRKPRKLPAATVSATYALEYGTDTLEIHRDAVGKGQKVIIVDDLIATGGTARASAELVEKLGATVAGFAFIVELTFLKGREKLNGYDVYSMLQYDR
jgi:adenine phosphoribosyltransferase